MLVLSRKKSEKIKLGDSIEITVVRISGNKVRLGIQAPPNVEVLRQELDKPVPPVVESWGKEGTETTVATTVDTAVWYRSPWGSLADQRAHRQVAEGEPTLAAHE